MCEKPKLTTRIFTYIRTKKNIKSNIGPIANEYGVLIQDSEQMVKILNTNFASVFTIENRDTVSVSPALSIEVASLKIDNVTQQKMQKYLDKLQVNKPTGPDNLSLRVVKELRQQILKPFASIFNNSVQQKKSPRRLEAGKRNTDL